MEEKKRLVDLTHTVNSEIPTWSGSCGFHSEIKMDYDQGVRVMQFKLHGSAGTHMDAPIHFIRGGKDIASLPLDTFFVPLVCIDISEKATKETKLLKEDVLAFEAKNGKIEQGSFVILNTGWEKYWNQKEIYQGDIGDGKKHFPSFGKEAGEVLMERGVVGVGIDTLSPDIPESGYPIHHMFLGAGKYIIENMCNLKELPPKGSKIACFPAKMEGAAEFPVRAVAML